MNPAEATQRGRTEFWENIRDEKISEHDKTLLDINMLRPVDALIKYAKMRRIREFLVRAAEIIDESYTADATIKH